MPQSVPRSPRPSAPPASRGEPVLLGSYRLLGSLGAGPDGATWRAEDAGGHPARVVRLADADESRLWTRARRLRLGGLVEHPAVLRLRPALVMHPPFVAMPPITRRWDEVFAEGRVDPGTLRTDGARLADGLAAMHALGLFAGDLGPTRVVVDAEGRPCVDCTGLDADGLDRGADRLTRAPEVDGGAFDGAADVYALACLLVWGALGPPPGLLARPPADRPAMWRGRLPDGDPLTPLLRAMLADDPEERPSAARVARQLLLAPGESPEADRTEPGADPPDESGTAPLPRLPDFSDADAGPEAEADTPPGLPRRSADGGIGATLDGDVPAPRTIGRFELGTLLGEGAMGQVFESIDPADGARVAIKVLRSSLNAEARFRKRFDKEVRLLRSVRHPRIANLVDAGLSSEGLPFLALEFVEGRPLSMILRGARRLDVDLALRIAADVLRALGAVHAAGIVHRDIKPANVMVRGAGASTVAVLCDFGIARLIDAPDDERLTAVGALVGTPHYMSPEQARGQPVDGRADLYALGVMLYELLTGDPPFDCPNPTGLLIKHIQEPPAPLGRARPDVPEPVAAWIHRLLAKTPDDRPADAARALDEVLRLLRGEPTDVQQHPPLPETGEGVQGWTWSWDLASPASALWPLVSDTRRINRAMGLNAFDVDLALDDGLAFYRASQRLAGMEARWDEQPMEWVEGRRIGNLRIYEKGPLEWMRAVTDLEPLPGGGTRVVQTVQLKARYGFTRLVASYEAGIKTRKAYEQLFARFDAHLQGRAAGQIEAAIADPFEPAAKIEPGARSAIELAHQRLRPHPLDPIALDRLVRFIAEAPPPALNRLRPRALADRLQVDADDLVRVCLHAVREGLLVLLWDLLCPVCRVPSDIARTLAEIANHGHCQVCDLDFELDFAGSVELIFRPHPSIRRTDEAMYCIGGPAQAPHIAAQVRLSPGERLALNLILADGAYRLAGRRLPYAAIFRVHADAPHDQWDVELGPAGADSIPRSLRSGRQRVVLTNGFDQDVLVRLERLAERDDALTAADAMGIDAFRQLFPHECLSPGALVNVARITLLRTAICEMGRIYADDGPRAFARLHQHFERVARVVADHGGSVVKVEGDGLVCAFAEPGQAVRAAFDLGARETELRLRGAVHGGPAYAATIDGRLDYFGRTVHHTAMLLARARPGQVVIGEPLSFEPDVARALAGRPDREVVQLAGGLMGLRYRWSDAADEEGTAPAPAVIRSVAPLRTRG